MNTTPALPRYRLSLLHPLAPIVLLIALLSGTALHGGETTIFGQPRNIGDEATIRALEDEGRLAILQRDYATLERIWSDRFVVNTPGNFVLSGRTAVLDLFRQHATSMYSSFEKSIECIAFDGDLAIVMGLEIVTPKSGARQGQTAQRRYTNVWRFANGAWLLIARQATMQPPGAPSGPPALPSKA